jgi:hypothetical protein
VCRVALTITAPAEDGEYVCEIDLAHEGVLWFSDKGSPTVRFLVRVGVTPQDLDAQGSSRTALAAPERPIDFSSMSLNVLGQGGGSGPGDFPMHGIQREAVVDLIARHGGHLIHIEDDHSCGAEWVSFRYCVKRA